MQLQGITCFTRTLAAIDLLLSNSEYVQRTFREQFTDIPKRAWAKEFCTVKVCGGRKTAHTTAAVYTALRFSRSLFITQGKEEAEKAQEIAKNIYTMNPESDAMEKIIFHGVSNDPNDQSFLNASIMPSLDLIIVDMASLLSPNALNQVYDLYCEHVRSIKLPFYFLFME